MKCCDITAGKLRHSVVWQEKIQTPDGGGGFTYTTSDVVTTRAFIKPISTNERFFAQRIESDISHKIYIRYRTDISPDMRINYGGRLFQVKGIMNIEEQNKWLEVSAVEGEATW